MPERSWSSPPMVHAPASAPSPPSWERDAAAKHVEKVSFIMGSSKVPSEVIIEHNGSNNYVDEDEPAKIDSSVNIFGKLLENGGRKDGSHGGAVFTGINSAVFDIIQEHNPTPLLRNTGLQKNFEATLWRGRDKILGLIITPDFGPNFLYIEDIWENSVVSEWNGAHEPSSQIHVGDVITAVNGVSSEAREMLRSIRGMPMDASIHLRIEDLPSDMPRAPKNAMWMR